MEVLTGVDVKLSMKVLDDELKDGFGIIGRLVRNAGAMGEAVVDGDALLGSGFKLGFELDCFRFRSSCRFGGGDGDGSFVVDC